VKGTKFLCMKAIPEGKYENLTRHALSAMTVYCRKATHFGEGLFDAKSAQISLNSDTEPWPQTSDIFMGKQGGTTVKIPSLIQGRVLSIFTMANRH